jgi:hypothetical protein
MADIETAPNTERAVQLRHRRGHKVERVEDVDE